MRARSPSKILALQVIEKTAPAPDQLEQPAPRVVVLRVRPEMLRQLVDPRASASRPGPRSSRCPVRCAPCFVDQLLLRFLGESHWFSSRRIVSAIPARREGRARPAEIAVGRKRSCEVRGDSGTSSLRENVPLGPSTTSSPAALREPVRAARCFARARTPCSAAASCSSRTAATARAGSTRSRSATSRPQTGAS